MATIVAEVRNSGLFRTRKMPIFQLTVGQGRSRLRCLFFNATYLQDKFVPGQMIALYGKVEQDERSRELQIVQPQFEVLGDPGDSENGAEKKAAESLEIGRIVPIYEATGRLTPRWFRRAIRTALDNLTSDLPDPIPAAVRSRTGTGLAAHRAVERALAGAGGELLGAVAIVPYAGTRPDDL